MPKGSSLRSKPPALTGETQPKPRRATGKHVGESKAKRLMKKRCGGLCEPRIPGAGCLYFVSDLHHRLFQSQGGEWEIRNSLGVCRPCHLVLTNPNGRRKEFEHYGWIVPSHGNPPAVEVYMWHDERRDWFLLLEDGTVERAPFPAGDPRHPDDIEVPAEDRGLGETA